MNLSSEDFDDILFAVVHTRAELTITCVPHRRAGIDNIPRCHYDKCSVAKRNPIDQRGIQRANRKILCNFGRTKREKRKKIVFAVNPIFVTCFFEHLD